MHKTIKVSGIEYELRMKVYKLQRMLADADKEIAERKKKEQAYIKTLKAEMKSANLMTGFLLTLCLEGEYLPDGSLLVSKSAKNALREHIAQNQEFLNMYNLHKAGKILP